MGLLFLGVIFHSSFPAEHQHAQVLDRDSWSLIQTGGEVGDVVQADNLQEGAPAIGALSFANFFGWEGSILEWTTGEK